MPITLTASDLSFICREADFAAGKIVRQLGLPAHDREDIRQDLLLDLIARLPAFDPVRGSLGAFANTVFVHRAYRISRRAAHERRMFGRQPVSTDDPIDGATGMTRGDCIAEEDGLPALFGQPTDRAAAVERRLDLEWALGMLRPAQIALCAALHDRTPTTLGEAAPGGRSGVYRRVRDLRLALTAVGLLAA